MAFDLGAPIVSTLSEFDERITALEQQSNSGPTWLVDPSITSDGSPAVGETLTGQDGLISNGSAVGRQWLRGTTAIAGATGASYLLVTADNGQPISLRVTATGPGGSAQKISAAVSVAPLPNVSIAGPTAQAEGDSGTTLFNFTVNRSSTAGTVAIPWSFQPGTTGASDFVGNAYPVGGVVNLADGAVTGAITISVRGEQIVEADEYFTISITPPAGYVGGAQTMVTSTIVNTDVLVPADIASIDAEGAFAQWNGTPPTLAPDENPRTFQMLRQGFDVDGQPTTYSAQRIITKRVRQPYPNQETLTPSRVSMDDYVYSTDMFSEGLNPAPIVNNSTEASPMPHARWGKCDRHLVGNTVELEVLAFHRDGISCVEFTVTDGTNTITQRTSQIVISPTATDRFAVLVYRVLVDVSTLANSTLITANARVYPKIGTSSSVRDSSINVAGSRSFCPQIFVRDTVRFAAPPMVYVAVGGNDTTGVVSTDPATAAASPCATYSGAWLRARAVLGTAAGALNGLRIRLGAGSWTRTAATTLSVTDCFVTVERDPAVAKGDAVVTFGASTTNQIVHASYTRFHDCTLRRVGVNNMGSGTKLLIGSVDFDPQGNTAALHTSIACANYFEGTTFIAGITVGSILQASANYEIRSIRGVKAGGFAAGKIGLEDFLVVGNDIINVGLNSRPRSYASNIIAFNRFLGCGGATDVISPICTDGLVIVQNVFEWAFGTTRVAGITADGALDNSYHVIMWNNVFTGSGLNGRLNLFYNETNGTVRTHKLNSLSGNIYTQLNTKHDVFQGLNHGDPNGDASTRVGGWSYLFGAGCYGEFTMFRDAGGGQWTQEYVGFGSKMSTSITERLDPLFVDFRSVNIDGTAGTGGGDYRVTNNSPVKGIVLYGRLPFDLLRNPRPTTNDSAGPYVPLAA